MATSSSSQVPLIGEQKAIAVDSSTATNRRRRPAKSDKGNSPTRLVALRGLRRSR
jgi:hypothetical protein